MNTFLTQIKERVNRRWKGERTRIHKGIKARFAFYSDKSPSINLYNLKTNAKTPQRPKRKSCSAIISVDPQLKQNK